ncbi:class I SAM-dependent methyltransferase [Salipiger bermudensis]|uniref:class I SAM-dependent methyltransferase n=1 Tax=Salipiger bermudensis TaxID=344736 RepID=UPI001CD7D119|nr:class I SAM-dependent methyltransferase [Salipiger bermudensis]MCA1288170.1 class I SAM-dependent methyltransferase [Salipiger bermudensis]
MTEPKYLGSSYEELAGEYYDTSRHPTCRDLRKLSLSLIAPILDIGIPGRGNLLEVGSGRTILAPAAAAAGALSRTFITDSSPTMLTYSRRWLDHGATIFECRADATNMPDESVSLMLASLGDPYNTLQFWQEAARILRPDGCVIFTTPSYQWSKKFRIGSDSSVAEFLNERGETVHVPSLVYDSFEQSQLVAEAGMEIVDSSSVGLNVLGANVAPKLQGITEFEPAVVAYIVQRRSR